MGRSGPSFSELIVASLCAGLALFDFQMAFGFMDTRDGAPLTWKIALDTIIGVIVLIGVVLGFSTRRFPWYVLLTVPPLIRAFMLRPSQLDLYPAALILGAYTDLLFLVGTAIGIALRWARPKTVN
jgi:hypothetical protein